MTDYAIKSAVAGTTLFAGKFRNFQDCIETAIGDGIDLRRADLRHRNLQNTELDGADFTDALFIGSNLTGANLSEACLIGADFSDVILHGAVLCESDLTRARFDGTLFGATEIFDATLQDCVFSTLSAFTLRFDEARTMAGAHFINPCGLTCPMSRPPVVMSGLTQDVVIMDRHIKVGHSVFALDSIPDWIASGGLNPRNLRLRIDQILLALMMDDKTRKIA